MTEPLEVLAAIDAAVYGDVFDCAVTEDELWRYSRSPISRDQLRRLLGDDEALRGTLCERDGLYCLTGREALVRLHPEQRRRGLRLRRRARAVARIVQHAPFVRGLLLTGSAAAGNAEPGADIDLLVIVAPGRMSTVFALLGTVARLLSRQVLCPNHYLSEHALEVSRRRNHYVAREVAQAWALTHGSTAFGRANRWVRSELPNAEPHSDPVQPLPGGRLVQSAVEWPLRGRLGDRFERALGRLAWARLQAHYARFGVEVPHAIAEGLRAGSELRFHGVSSDGDLLDLYESRRSAVREALAG